MAHVINGHRDMLRVVFDYKLLYSRGRCLVLAIAILPKQNEDERKKKEKPTTPRAKVAKSPASKKKKKKKQDRPKYFMICLPSMS